ncbi:MAG: DNA topoisomerase I [Kordiimonas sp.]|nr:DNA topoisomerase I [Kordiimonas sp.]
MNVVIVESPAKAKTINKYLGKDYTVLASFGHIRDLPSKDGSVKPEEDFSMRWAMDSDSKKRIKDIVAATKTSDKLILATDPDREGEAISWHVLEVLKKEKILDKIDVERVVFNEITKNAILKAMESPRHLDQELVDAYLARRALDYLVGFTLSPVLWRKLPGARSAGRVQSVALRLICDRELQIEIFKPEEYWTVDADFHTATGQPLTARLTHLDGTKLDKFSLSNAEKASAAKQIIEQGKFTVHSVVSKPAKRNPYPPFTTSTLQQEASRKLGFSASRTMQVAQRLYEGTDIGGETIGLITYMRTDGVTMAQEAINGCRQVIAHDFGDQYLPEKPRLYKSKAKNAQEAHEAIRPTDLSRKPQDLASILDKDQYRLYELIWKRTIACQMRSAEIERTTAEIISDANNAVLRATGAVQKFDGFLKLYQESRDDSRDDSEERRLPPLNASDALDQQKVNADQHFTEPPPRFTEASLVKKMEELGIGRPSTYASILSVLRDRNYVQMEKNRFIPEDKGRLVTAFLENFFHKYVQYDFTADLEGQLDLISSGDIPWKKVLADFWEEFKKAVDETAELRITNVLDTLNDVLGPYVFPQEEDGKDPRLCPKCGKGQLSIKTSRYGAFIGCSDYPECKFTRPLKAGGEDEAMVADDGPKVLGIDPQTQMEVTLRTGRFGPYIQLGEPVDKKEKPKRATIPKDLVPDDIDLDKALALLSLPRQVGVHPESGKDITATIGRYGPYLSHDGTSASLDSTEDVFTVGVNRAVAVLADSKNKKRGSTSKSLKELGPHPEDNNPVQVMDGRYGPYVKHNKINATIPKDKTPESITMEEAIELLKARAAKTKTKTKAKPKAKTATKRKTTTRRKTAASKQE